MKLEDHPTVRKFRALEQAGAVGERRPFGAEELKELARACGAHDVGFIGIDRAELDPQRDEILRHYPWTRSLLSIKADGYILACQAEPAGDIELGA